MSSYNVKVATYCLLVLRELLYYVIHVMACVIEVARFRGGSRIF